MAYTDRFPIVNNFLETRLSADCDEGETTLFLEGVEALPRILAGRDYIPLVLRDAGTVREIVYVEGVDAESSAITVLRGQEGTNAAAWSAGSYVYCTVTADSFQRMRVNGFAPLVDGTSGRPEITVTSKTTASIAGDFTEQVEVGMAVRVLTDDSVVAPTDATMGGIYISSVEYSGGVTNVAFQNVELPKDVIGIDLGLSSTSAPMYHPDTIVADNETTTQIGNVISADLAVQKAIQAVQQNTSSLDESLRVLIAEEVKKCLPLVGGTMTGGIVFASRSGMNVIAADSANSYLQICGGSSYANGASAAFYGVTDPKTPGAFKFHAADNANGLTLFGGPDGRLVWDNKNIVRTINGQNADVNGSVRLWVEDKGNVSANTLTSAGVYCLNGSSTNLPSGTNGYVVVECLGSNSAIRQVFYRIGTVDSNDHNIYTRQRNSSGTWGAWVKILTSKDVKAQLTTTWRSGNSWYRKYSDGWIEQGGLVMLTTEDPRSVKISLHTAFATTNYIPQVTLCRTFDSDQHWSGSGSRTTTAFTVYPRWFTKNHGFFWSACGF